MGWNKSTFQNGLDRIHVTGRFERWLLYLPWIVFLILVSRNISDWRHAEQIRVHLVHTQSENTAELILNQLRNTVHDYIRELNHLAEIWMEDLPDPENRFLYEANWFIQNDNTYCSIYHSDADQRIRVIISPENQSDLLGFDQTTLPQREKKIQQLLQSGHPILSTSLSESIGIPILEITLPIIDNSITSKSVQGYITGVFHRVRFSDKILSTTHTEMVHVSIYQDDVEYFHTDNRDRCLETHPLNQAVTLHQNLYGANWRIHALFCSKSGFNQLYVQNYKQLTINGILSLLVSTLLAFLLRALIRMQKSQEEVRLSQDHFHSLTENSDSYMVYQLSVDPPHPMLAKITFVSHSIESVLGKENARDLSTWFDAVHEDDRETLWNKHVHCMQTGEPFACTFRFFHPRKKIWKWIKSLANAVFDPQGVPLFYNGLLIDITEQKQTEQALRESEENYRELVQNANSIILRMDIHGTITFFNEYAQQFFGYSEEEILGQNFMQRIVPQTEDSQQETLQAFQDFFQSPEKGGVRESEHIRRNGESVWIVWTLKPMYDGKNELVGILCIGNDITALKDLQEQFRQSQKMEAIGQLASGVAHDFNNLLMAILGFSDLALRSKLLDESLRKHVKEIRLAGERATSLTRQLLAFSRKQVFHLVVLNLNHLILNMDKMLRRLIGEDIELITLTADSLGAIKADSGQIEQILMNLIVNARDAMLQGGTITITTNNVFLDDSYTSKHFNIQSGPYIHLSVQDTGEGIPKELQDRIFDPFYTTKEHGTGLGLSTVYGIVKQSDGYLLVDSQPGVGSTFNIYFPQVLESTQETISHDEILLDPNVSQTILVVEDEKTVRHLVARVLRRHGYRVLEAGYGSEALELVNQHGGDIHLLITDVIMPKMNGHELASRLMRILPQMHVLYMSGYTDETIAHHGVLDEGIAFLKKPFSSDQLLKKVQEIFHTHNANLS